jgi:hypothetical protein
MRSGGVGVFGTRTGGGAERFFATVDFGAGFGFFGAATAGKPFARGERLPGAQAGAPRTAQP